MADPNLVAFDRGVVDERVDTVARCVEHEVVGATAALDGVVVAPAIEIVGAATALERVVLVLAGEVVVAFATRERICRLLAIWLPISRSSPVPPIAFSISEAVLPPNSSALATLPRAK